MLAAVAHDGKFWLLAEHLKTETVILAELDTTIVNTTLLGEE